MILESLLVKILVGSAALLTSLRYGGGFWLYVQTEKLERPSYEVIAQLANGVELRRYEPYLIAETTIESPSGGTIKDSAGKGFGPCAGYIFGKNQKKETSFLPRLQQRFSLNRKPEAEKMAMTAPVRISSETTAPATNEKMAMTAPVRIQGDATVSSSAKPKKTKVSFVVGKKYNLQTAPIPLNSKVQIRQIPAHTLAVRTFAGPTPTDEKVQQERALIEASLQTAEKATKTSQTSETLIYGYHDPNITPNFLRRNEVAVLVEGSL